MLGSPLSISCQLAPRTEPLLMTRIAASSPNQRRARVASFPIQPPVAMTDPATSPHTNGDLIARAAEIHQANRTAGPGATPLGTRTFTWFRFVYRGLCRTTAPPPSAHRWLLAEGSHPRQSGRSSRFPEALPHWQGRSTKQPDESPRVGSRPLPSHRPKERAKQAGLPKLPECKPPRSKASPSCLDSNAYPARRCPQKT